MSGANDETGAVTWLCGQLRELDRWKSELLDAPEGAGGQLERVDAHRRWLESALAAMSEPPLSS